MASPVTVTITQDTLGVARLGFGTALFLSNTASFVERVRSYTSLAEVAVDFAATTSAEYLAAQAYFSQNPHPVTLKIGRAALPATQVQTLTPVASDSTDYVVTVTGDGITTTEVSVTSDGDATVAEIITALTTALNAVVGKNYTAVDGTTVCTVTATAAGDWFSIAVANPALITSELTHVDPGVATDLTAIETVDDDWYALITTYNSNAVVLAADAWIQTRKKIYLFDTNDGECATTAAGNSDTLDDIATLERARTAGTFHWNPAEMASAAWAGSRLCKEPGSATWKFASNLSGITTGMKLTSTQRANLVARNANFYEANRGVKFFSEGTTADGDFIDVQIGLDWLEDDMGARIFTTLAAADKVEFEDSGVALIQADMEASLQEATNRKILAKDPAFTTQVPKVADVSAADKLARTLPDLKFSGTLSGAIHKANVTGVVSV